MDIALHIPEWLLWALGVGVVIPLIGFAILGIAFVRCFGGGLWR